MPNFIKCEVMMNRLMIEKFDGKTGEPIIEKKTDIYGNKFKEVMEVIYRRGDIIALPESVVKKLGKSIAVVMAPVTMEEVIEPESKPEKGELKGAATGKTVEEIIPKNKDKGKDK